ncbi:hypothetical protein J6TS2_12930 [Heyndrickxia sporothermodurans]|nr:hypothetical protein J6TS2_12930 [Heyndrickxia sporothermodurans]
MRSIYEKVLGEQFQLLHPKLQEKFSLKSIDQCAIISKGVMKEITGGFILLRPLFFLGIKKRIVFPERGENIPFTLENYAYQDSFGRECVVWARTFQFPSKIRHFDATMIFNAENRKIVDYFGTHHDFISDLELKVTKIGSLRIRSKSQRIIWNGWSIALPAFLRGEAEIVEWFDEYEKVFKIHVKVRNRLVGTLFEYHGSCQTEFVDMPTEKIPCHIKPIKEQARE